MTQSPTHHLTFRSQWASTSTTPPSLLSSIQMHSSSMEKHPSIPCPRSPSSPKSCSIPLIHTLSPRRPSALRRLPQTKALPGLAHPALAAPSVHVLPQWLPQSQDQPQVRPILFSSDSPEYLCVLDAVSAYFSQNSGPFVAPFQPHIAMQQPLPPTPSPPPMHTSQGPQTHVINTVVTGRPKTSHTTIERRYRTNLNARIQSLKAAVPALRILDQNNRNDEYKVDDRGYIDGVKVARKGSKANVLGKAVEYIR